MKTKKIILTTAILIYISVNSIAQTFEWAKGLGGTGDDYGTSIAIDDSGNVYTTGYFEGTVDFDPGTGIYNLSSTGAEDIFILKLDASGNFVWAKKIGGINDDRGNSITVDASGNIYTTGCFRDTVDFDPNSGTNNLKSYGNYSVYILKLDVSGNFVWAKKLGRTINMGGGGFGKGYSIAVDVSGNVYTTGYFCMVVDFDPGPGTFHINSHGWYDIFVHKLDSAGNFIWVKQMGSSGREEGHSIAVDNLGNIYTTGFFMGQVDFDPGPNTYNLLVSGNYSDINVFVQKLDTSGKFVWAKNIGGPEDEKGQSITVYDLGTVYLTGWFKNTVDFDPGPNSYNLTSAGDNDIFILKLDTFGNFVWAKQIGGGNKDEGHSLTIDELGNAYITGGFWGTIDFDPGPGIYNLTSTDSSDIFIQKLDAYGNLVFAKGMGGAYWDEGRSITLNPSGNIYTTGSFKGLANFNPGIGINNLTSAGKNDIFIHKLNCNPSNSATTVITCDSFFSPSGNYVWTTSGNYIDTIPNTIGCDSLIIVNLTIKNMTTSTINDTVCDRMTSPSGNYIWTISGTYLDTIPNTAGCDSVITVNLTINNTTSTINKTVCSNFTYPSGNYSWTKSGTYQDTLPNAIGCDSIITINLTVNDNTSSTINKTACFSYTSPSSNYLWTTSGTYLDTIPNSTGCDSVITVNLTINTVDTSITQAGAILSSNAHGATYQWLDCNDGYSIITGKTNQSFIVTMNGSYAVEIIQNSCVDTSSCYSIMNVGVVITNSFTEELSVYPNPTKGNFTIDLGSKHERIYVTVTDINGKEINNKVFRQQQLLNLTFEKTKGIYIVKIESKDKQAVIRLMKQ